MKKNSIDAVIVTSARSKLLDEAIESILNACARAKMVGFRLHVLFPAEEKETEVVIEKYQNQGLPVLAQTSLHKLSPAEGRNRIMKNCHAEWICFLDDDIKVPIDFFVNFFALLYKFPMATVFGGPNLTAAAQTFDEEIIGNLLSSRLVTGPVANRYRLLGQEKQGNQFNLMLCNLFVCRHLLTQTPFSAELRTCEENEYLERLEQSSSHWVSSDSIFVWHHRRKNIGASLRQIYGYGFGRGQVLRKRFQAAHIKFLLPLAILLITIGLFFIKPVASLWIVAAIFSWNFFVVIETFLKLKRAHLKFMFLPILIWTEYSLGIASGITHQVFESLLQKRKPAPE